MNMHKNARPTPLGRERLVGMIAGGFKMMEVVTLQGGEGSRYVTCPGTSRYDTLAQSAERAFGTEIRRTG